MAGPGPLSSTARGVLCGALGGAIAGALDHVMAVPAARQFLPDGSLRLLAFLAALYAAAGGVVGGFVGLVAHLSLRFTDLGPLADAAFGAVHKTGAGASPQSADNAAEAHKGARLLAYAASAAIALVLLGAAVRQVTLLGLLRFHSPLLISAFAGALSAVLACAFAFFAVLFAAALSPVLRAGRRFDPRPAAPAAAYTLAWTLGLALAAAAVARLVFAVQQNRRLPPADKALQVGLWAPAILVFALALFHLLARTLGRRLDENGAFSRASRSPSFALALPGTLLLFGAAFAAASAWPIVKLLPLRPAFIAAAAGLLALGLALSPFARSLDPRRLPWPGFAVILCLPALLLGVAVRAGRADRVQKAATTHAALAAPLLDALHAGWDFDRDGYSPLLGADCNDLDPEVHPGAFDWPDDGIDQNCNGHEATLVEAPRAPFIALPENIPHRPNFVLITVDALRADHVGAYGYGRATTPRIDALAKEAVLFKNGWAHSPSTRYSVPAILTGRYESTIAWGSPSQHWPPQVLPENRLLSEMFHDLGYHTGALVPAHYFEPGWGLNQGFDDYDNSLAHLHGNISGDPARATGSSSRELGDLGVKWIVDAAKQQKPFFLWMHFYDPHYLYERHPEAPDFGSPNPTDIDLYDNEVAFTDMHIGRVLDALRAAGHWDDTAVIVTADHGEGFGEHGVRQHGYHIYAQQNKVPFVVKMPGVAPRTVEDAVGHVDLFPSFLNVLRAPDEPQLLGRSFLDLMLGSASGTGPRMVFEEVDYEGPTARKAVATKDHQLIANVVPDGTCELYDLASDPAEAHDLFVRGAGGEQGRLESALGEWMDAIALPRDFRDRVAKNLSQSPIASEIQLDASLGRMLAIDGASVPTKIVHPGDTAEVDLVLHVPARIPAGWRLFTHARSSLGGFVNLDHEPVEGFVPLAKLRPGQWVRDRVRFGVPPAWKSGTIDLEVGLWKGPTRAPATGGGAAGDHVRAATLQVAP